MVGQVVGYARVSARDQNEARQVEALADCDRLYVDKVSGKNTDRPELKAVLAYVREGDTLRIPSMDRFARNLDDLRRMVRDLTGEGVRVEFVKEALAFTGEDSPMSMLLLSMLGAVAEFERSLIRERQAEGIAIAKAAGVYRGRKRVLTEEQVQVIAARVADGVPKAALAREFGVSRQTVYSALAAVPWTA